MKKVGLNMQSKIIKIMIALIIIFFVSYNGITGLINGLIIEFLFMYIYYNISIEEKKRYLFMINLLCIFWIVILYYNNFITIYFILILSISIFIILTILKKSKIYKEFKLEKIVIIPSIESVSKSL